MKFCQYIHYVFANSKKNEISLKMWEKNESFPVIEYLGEEYKDFEAVHDLT